MHKYVLKMFEGLKSFTKFLKIADVFVILMLLLYWIQNLIGSSWGWMNFIKPLLDFFIEIGKMLNSGSIMLFAAVFEFKYFIALLLILFVYFLIHVCYISLCKLQELYEAGNIAVKKIQENILNTKLAKEQEKEQDKIQKYVVYISASIKKNDFTKLSDINLQEQEDLMNKFLKEKTGVNPQNFNEGFLYNFDKFDKIDNTLEVLFKVLKSKAPLEFQICIMINNEDQIDFVKLSKLISLGLKNKISIMADTAYRYRFIDSKKYRTSQVGLFQKGDETFEIHEFVEDI